MKPYSLAIVGAGLCGLTIAENLKALVANRIILEKSKAIGGRMATRRDGDCVYDHGVQFIKQSNGRPFYWYERWLRADQIMTWYKDDEATMAYGKNGMTTLAKDLAQSHQVMLEEKIIKIEIIEGLISLISESGKVFRTERVVLTCPLPQCLELLRNSSIPYPDELSKITYVKALVGLFELDDPQGFLKEVQYKLLQPPVLSISNNLSKGLGKKLSVSVVMNSGFSSENFNKTDSEILDLIEYAFISQLMPSVKVKKRNLKKWRYSHALENHSEDFLPLSANPNIILAGDAFGGGSLGGTIRSALATELHLKKVMGFIKVERY